MKRHGNATGVTPATNDTAIQELSQAAEISTAKPNHRALLGPLAQQIHPGVPGKWFIMSKIFWCN